MCLFWFARGFWRLIRITPQVILSGCCTAGIIATTMAALAFKNTSVFKTALITRGSVLLLAPLSDLLSGNRITARGACASLLSASAIVLMHLHKLNGGAAEMPHELALVLCVYVLCYAVKLPLFSGPKRAGDAGFLISEQTVAVAVYSLYTLTVHGAPRALALPPLAIGMCSQLTGIYGGAVLIGRAEHTATVPLNRAASMLAGLIGSVLLGQHITRGQAAGFALLLLAVLILRKR
jgi:drug/metabolite transporter (DMT)-like permease